MKLNVRKMFFFSAVCVLDASKTMRAVQTVYDRVLRNAWTTTNTDQQAG